MNYIDYMKGGGIHIKEKNRGKFTESAHEAGKSVQEHATDVLNDPNATRLQKRRAQFAKNAKKWKHEDGGILHAQTGASVNLKYFKNTKKSEPDIELPKDEDRDEEQTAETETTTSTAGEGEDWISQYIRNYTGMGSTAVTQNPTTVTGSATAPSASSAATYKETMNYLMSKGFNKEAAAGITGVFMAESGLIAGRTNKEEDAAYGSTAGRGLGQWSNERRKQYDDYMRGKEITLQNDLDFFIQDLESRPLVKKALQNAINVEDAVKAMHLGYENGSAGAMATPEQLTKRYTEAWANLGYKPYSYGESHSKRYNFAQQAYNS